MAEQATTQTTPARAAGEPVGTDDTSVDQPTAEGPAQPAGAQPGTQPAGPPPAGTQPAGTQPAGGRRPLKRATKIRLIVIGAIALLIAIAFVVYYLVESRAYVTTDNAQIDGNQISIVAPATGTLTDWKGQQGAEIQSYQPVGRVAVQAGYSQPQVVVRAPATGTIAVNNEVEGAYVTAGTQLAIAYDSEGVFVTARVDETEIDAVHPGAAVKVEVDAFPDAHLTGHVAEIKTGAAGIFSPFGQSNTTGNFQKVTQVIPVKITIDDLDGLPLVPGMNVTVKIHRG